MRRGSTRSPSRARWLSLLAVLALTAALAPAAALAQTHPDPDPRPTLAPGAFDAEEAIFGLNKLGLWDKREGVFYDPDNIASSLFTNSDIAFQGDLAVMGNYGGLMLFDISDRGDPKLRTTIVCRGNQGDPSIYGNLVFMSAQDTAGRIDCGTQGNDSGETRFQGVRIFDISDPDNPEQVGGVQLCRGSHTHTLVEDLNDPDHVYIYNSGTSGVRSNTELARCNNEPADGDDPARWMTEVIKVPIADPAAAHVVTEARLFRDEETGRLDGLQNTPPTPQHPSGTNWSPTPNTNTCHDITAYPDLGIAAGACQGNGILIDISDPANPERLDAVTDPNFAYWHSATFNNDGTKVLFTDEWGGGTQARCRTTDLPSWGADAIFDIEWTDDGPQMTFASYYKLPVAQTTVENCVAHNGSLIPVPGRDIMVQAWYQGGLSIFDFTDSENPFEIAYFDRGPINGDALTAAGYWSTYWYDGHIYGTEERRSFDSFSLSPTDYLSAAEIAAAEEIFFEEWNTQGQRQYAWGPSLNVIGAHRDQLDRSDAITDRQLIRVNAFLDDADRASTKQQLLQAAAYGRHLASQLDADTQGNLVDAVTLVAEDLYNQARPTD